MRSQSTAGKTILICNAQSSINGGEGLNALLAGGQCLQSLFFFHPLSYPRFSKSVLDSNQQPSPHHEPAIATSQLVSRLYGGLECSTRGLESSQWSVNRDRRLTTMLRFMNY